MKFILKAYSILEYGQRKDHQGNPHQEDSLYPAFGEHTDGDRLFILCDGVGGHAAGEVASSEVCKAMSGYIKANCPNAEGSCPMFVLIDAVAAAFNALDSRISLATRNMGTTMTMLKLHSHGATIAHMGDSRVYHIRPGKTADQTVILHQTPDHSLVNELLRNGKITPEEARSYPHKNIITRAIQPLLKERPEAEFYRTTDIRPGDFFYLCTDGMLEQEEMNLGSGIRYAFSGEIASDDERVSYLRSATVDNRDNHSAYIIHILDVINDGAEQQPELPQIDPEDEPETVEVVHSHPAAAATADTPTSYEPEAGTEVEVLQTTIFSPAAASSQSSAVPLPRSREMPQTVSRPAPTTPAYVEAPSTQATVPSDEDVDSQSFFEQLADYLDDVFKVFGIKDYSIGVTIFVTVVISILLILLYLIIS